MRKTDATFKVESGVKIDGATGGTLTVEAPTANGTVLVTFRPKGRQRKYTLTLPEVCDMIAWRVAKKEA